MPFLRLLVPLLKRLMLVSIGSFIFTLSQAQSDREFWFAAPEVTSQHSDNPIFLRFTTYAKDAIITIDQPANASFSPIIINLVANSTYSLPFTAYKEIIENKPSNTELNYGIHITATASISAYYELASANNPEIFPLKGNVSKGLDFIIPAQTRFNNSCCSNGTTGTPYTFPAHNGFAIVATEDNTTINIDLTRPDEKGNSKITVMLNKGQTYAVNAASNLAVSHIGGSRVTSDKPICVTVYDDSIVIGGWDLKNSLQLEGNFQHLDFLPLIFAIYGLQKITLKLLLMGRPCRVNIIGVKVLNFNYPIIQLISPPIKMYMFFN
jgi:hypothetical protein